MNSTFLSKECKNATTGLLPPLKKGGLELGYFCMNYKEYSICIQLLC
jgi:hypothetical protein